MHHHSQHGFGPDRRDASDRRASDTRRRIRTVPRPRDASAFSPDVAPVISPRIIHAGGERRDVDPGIIRQADDLPHTNRRRRHDQHRARAVEVHRESSAHLRVRFGPLIDLDHVHPPALASPDRQFHVRPPPLIDLGPRHGVGVRPVGVEHPHHVDFVPEHRSGDRPVAPDVAPAKAAERHTPRVSEPPRRFEPGEPPLRALTTREQADPEQDVDPDRADPGEPQDPRIPLGSASVGGVRIGVGSDG